MPDSPEYQSVGDAAAQAAAAGDYESAERLLRELARLQEAGLGPLHPDLANTLNNLGVACELTGKPADAERCFRQAWAIAAAILAPDHPFVATSRKNLEDFCTARGKAVDSPAPPPAVAVERDAREARAADRPPAPPSSEAPRPVGPGRRSRSPLIGALLAGGLLVTFLAAAAWLRSNDTAEPSPGSASSPPESTAFAASPPIEPTPTDVPKESATTRRSSAGAGPTTPNMPSAAPVGRQVTGPPSAPRAAAESQATPEGVPESPVVASAKLCRDLSTAGGRVVSADWPCEPPSLPIGPGRLFFYTRLKSPTDTTVQHRWYRGDRLHQVVGLHIRANTASGFRTYSRDTIDSHGAGDWRVELRSSAGVLLHEERFVVR